MNHRYQDRRVRLKIVVSNLRLRSHGKVRRLRSGVTCGTAVPVVCHVTAVAGNTCTLDHDGCVVCSDAGIPMRVASLDGDDALCEDAAGNRLQVAVELVAPVCVNDVLLVHGGVAIGQIKGLLSDRKGDLGMARHRSARRLPIALRAIGSRRLRKKRTLKQ